jgi:hypothetical protein
MRRLDWQASGAACLFALVLVLPILGCGDEEHVNIFHAVFSADGVSKDFKTQVGFTSCPSTHCISYLQVQSDDFHNVLMLYLPTQVAANQEYTEASEHCFLTYIDVSGKYFDTRNTGSTLYVKVTEWAGPGGYAKGVFNAVAENDLGTEEVNLTSGTFEGFIHQ